MPPTDSPAVILSRRDLDEVRDSVRSQRRRLESRRDPEPDTGNMLMTFALLAAGALPVAFATGYTGNANFPGLPLPYGVIGFAAGQAYAQWGNPKYAPYARLASYGAGLASLTIWLLGKGVQTAQAAGRPAAQDVVAGGQNPFAQQAYPQHLQHPQAPPPAMPAPPPFMLSPQPPFQHASPFPPGSAPPFNPYAPPDAPSARLTEAELQTMAQEMSSP